MLSRIVTWRTAKWAAIAVVALVVAIQLVPYGRAHDNAAVVAEPNWDSPRTRELAKRACFDCHSNETTWPWYSNVAPASWLIQSDVDEGRRALNFSEWGGRDEAREAAETVREGEMPPSYYTWLHGTAKLSDAEKDELIQGFLATFGREGAGD